MGRRESMDAGRGAANWEVPPRATSLGCLFLLIQPHRLPVLKIIPWISPGIWRIEEIALLLHPTFWWRSPQPLRGPAEKGTG